MNSRREQVWVGIFVMIAAVVLIGVVLSVSGAFAKEGISSPGVFQVRQRPGARGAGSVRRIAGRQDRETPRGPVGLHAHRNRLHRACRTSR